MHKPKIFGFQHSYPQEFLDQLAKDLGFKWTKAKFTTIPKDKVSVQPMGPPSGVVHYIDFKYES